MLADVTIFVWCDSITGQWNVRAEFYHYPGGGPSQFLSGESGAPNVSVDDDGDFTGSVDIDMENGFGTVICSITVTFG